MECQRTVFIDENGIKIHLDKKKYPTMQKALNAANEQNKIRTNYIQRQAYHCSECGYFHVGRNGKALTHPEKKPAYRHPNNDISNFK